MARDCVSIACEPCKARRSKCDSVRPSCGACTRIFNKSSDQHCTYNLDGDMRTKGALRRVVTDLREIGELQDQLSRILLAKVAPHMDHGKPFTKEDLKGMIVQLGMTHPNNAAVYGMAFPKVEGPGSPFPHMGMAPQHNGAGFGRITRRIEMNLTPESPFSPASSVGSIGLQNLKFTPESPFSPSKFVYGPGNVPAASLPDQGNNSGWSTEVTDDQSLILELLRLYFRWVHPFYTLFVKHSFCINDRLINTQYCTSFLLNAILAAGCNYLSRPDKATLGEQFFNEARRQYEQETQCSIPQTQALGVISMYSLMNGKMPQGWKYQSLMMSGILDLSLHIPYKSTDFNDISKQIHEVTMWGCYNLHITWCEILARPLTVSRSIIQTAFPTPTQITEFMHWEDSELPCHQYTIIGALAALSLITKRSVNHLKVRASGVSVPETTLEAQYQEMQRWFIQLSDLLKNGTPGQSPLPQNLALHAYYYALVIQLMHPLLSCGSPESAVVRCTHAAKSILDLTNTYHTHWCSNNYTADPKNAYTFTMAYCVFLAADVSISNLAMHHNGSEAAIRLNQLICTLFMMEDNLPIAKQFLSRLKATIIKRNYPTQGWHVLNNSVNILFSRDQNQSGQGIQQAHQPASQSIRQPAPQLAFIPNNLENAWGLRNDAATALEGNEAIDPNLISNQGMALYHQNFSNNVGQNQMDGLTQDLNAQFMTQAQFDEPSGSSDQQQAVMLEPVFDDSMFVNENPYDTPLNDFEQVFRQQVQRDEAENDFML